MMTYHYPDLDNASDWLREILNSRELIRSVYLHVHLVEDAINMSEIDCFFFFRKAEDFSFGAELQVS